MQNTFMFVYHLIDISALVFIPHIVYEKSVQMLNFIIDSIMVFHL